MLWRKKKAEDSPPVPVPGPVVAASHPIDVDDVLDTTASILRAFGKHAFDVGELEAPAVAASFERWAAHVLTAAPLDGPRDEAANEGTTASTARREWRRLVRLVNEHRQTERTHVERTTQEAREAIWALVDGVGRACIEHGKADGELRDRAARLATAVASESIAELKREAGAFTGAVVQYLEAQNLRLTEQTNALRERLARLETQLDDARREGGIDALTRLANRKVFDATLQQQMALGTVTGRPLSLVMVDVDHFKSVNDRHGHPAGDKVLRDVADAIVRTFPRRSDLVARYGGEEFACVLPETAPDNALKLVERLCSGLRGRELELPSGSRLRVTLSAGIAVHRPGEDSDAFVARADRSLYTAKHQGRDRVIFAEDAA